MRGRATAAFLAAVVLCCATSTASGRYLVLNEVDPAAFGQQAEPTSQDVYADSSFVDSSPLFLLSDPLRWLTQQLQFIEALQRQALNDFVFAEAGGTSGADSLTQEQKLQLIGASRLEAAMADAQRSSSDGASTTQQQRPAVQSQDYEDDDYFGANVEYYDIYYDDYYADDYFYGSYAYDDEWDEIMDEAERRFREKQGVDAAYMEELEEEMADYEGEGFLPAARKAAAGTFRRGSSAPAPSSTSSSSSSSSWTGSSGGAGSVGGAYTAYSQSVSTYSSAEGLVHETVTVSSDGATTTTHRSVTVAPHGSEAVTRERVTVEAADAEAEEPSEPREQQQQQQVIVVVEGQEEAPLPTAWSREAMDAAFARWAAAQQQELMERLDADGGEPWDPLLALVTLVGGEEAAGGSGSGPQQQQQPHGGMVMPCPRHRAAAVPDGGQERMAVSDGGAAAVLPPLAAGACSLWLADGSLNTDMVTLVLLSLATLATFVGFCVSALQLRHVLVLSGCSSRSHRAAAAAYSQGGDDAASASLAQPLLLDEDDIAGAKVVVAASFIPPGMTTTTTTGVQQRFQGSDVVYNVLHGNNNNKF